MEKKKEWRYFNDYFYESKNFIALKQMLSPQLETQIIELRNKYSPIEYLDFLVFCSKINTDSESVLNEMKKLEKQFNTELRELKKKNTNYNIYFSREFKVLNGEYKDILVSYDKKQIENLTSSSGHNSAVDKIANSGIINHWFDEIKAANILYN